MPRDHATSAPDTPHAPRHRQAFWLDNRFIDEIAPVLGRYPFGTTALAIYPVLARRAGRDGESWPRLHAIAEQVGMSERTVQRAITLLELLGLLEVTMCYEDGNNRQTSNRYTLLPLPPVLPVLDPDPRRWPRPARTTSVVRPGQRAHIVTDARQHAPASVPAEVEPPRQGVTPAPVTVSPRPRHSCHPAPHNPVTPSPVTLSPQEGLPSSKDNPVKDVVRLHDFSALSFTIDEVGLSGRQVWAATLAELARGGAVSATEVEAWLRPAALAGRDGETLLLAAPSQVARDRIAARLLPEVRRALAATLGVSLPVSVIVAEPPPGAAGPQRPPGGRETGRSAA